MDTTPNHLTYDEQLKAVVGLSDLSDSRQLHLDRCKVCRHAVDEIQHRLVRLGKTAEALAPAPRRPFRLPQGLTGSRRSRPRTMWATGAVAFLLLLALVVWGPERFFSGPDSESPLTARQAIQPPVNTPTANTIDDQRLMAQIDALIENALPEPYRELAAVSDPSSNLDEDLINWIVPSIEIEEDDSLT